jgi:hypothetical protein
LNFLNLLLLHHLLLVLMLHLQHLLHHHHHKKKEYLLHLDYLEVDLLVDYFQNLLDFPHHLLLLIHPV